MILCFSGHLGVGVIIDKHNIIKQSDLMWET